MPLHQTEPTMSDCGNIIMLPEGVGLALQDEPKQHVQNQLTEPETVSKFSNMALLSRVRIAGNGDGERLRRCVA